MQLLLPVVLVKVPVPHWVALVAPVPGTKLPAGAGVQALKPVVAAKVPTAQTVWLVWPVVPTKLPTDAKVQLN